MESVHIDVDVSLSDPCTTGMEEKLYICQLEVGGSAHMCFAARLNPCSTVDLDAMICLSWKHRP